MAAIQAAADVTADATVDATVDVTADATVDADRRLQCQQLTQLQQCKPSQCRQRQSLTQVLPIKASVASFRPVLATFAKLIKLG